MGIPLLLGLLAAFFWPYAALELGRYSVPLLMALMLIATASSQWKPRLFLLHLSEPAFWAGIFASLFLLPALLWVLAYAAIRNEALIYGIFWASLCPCALVAPAFTKLQHGAEEFSYSLVLGTSLLFPFSAPLMNYVFYPADARFPFLPLFLELLLVVTAPCLLGLLLQRLRPGRNPPSLRVVRSLSWVNMALIGILFYCVMGVAVARVNFLTIAKQDLAILTALALILDFGVYFAARKLLPHLCARREGQAALEVSLSMKNVAIAGTLLLFELPMAALASGLVLLVHSALFTMLGRGARR